MPIPKPKPNESKDAFISRCMGNDTMNSEYPDNKQRAAVCYSSWKNTKKAINLINTPLSVRFTVKEDDNG